MVWACDHYEGVFLPCRVRSVSRVKSGLVVGPVDQAVREFEGGYCGLLGALVEVRVPFGDSRGLAYRGDVGRVYGVGGKIGAVLVGE